MRQRAEGNDGLRVYNGTPHGVRDVRYKFNRVEYMILPWFDLDIPWLEIGMEYCTETNREKKGRGLTFNQT